MFDIFKLLCFICGVDLFLDFMGLGDLFNFKKDGGLLEGVVKKEGIGIVFDVVFEEEEWMIV